MATDMLLPSTSGPSRASDSGAEDPWYASGLVQPDWKCDMADLRKPDEPDRDHGRALIRAEIVIAILSAITALAGCVEQLAR